LLCDLGRSAAIDPDRSIGGRGARESRGIAGESVMNSRARRRRASVGIANFAFLPAARTIAAGETVNQDAAPHAVQAKDGRASDLLVPGTRYSRRFDKPATSTTRVRFIRT